MLCTKELSMASIRTAFIAIGTVGTTIWLCAFSLASQSQAATFSALANVIGDGQEEERTTEADSLVSTSSAGFIGKAEARASAASDLSLTTFASSEKFGVSAIAQGVAFIVSNYTITGGPDISYPLSFNSKLTGSLKASTAPRTPPSIASALFSSSTSVGEIDTFRVAGLTSQAGIPIINTSGTFSESDSRESGLRAEVTPTLSIGAEILQLGDEDLQFLSDGLGLQLEREIPFRGFRERVSVLEGLIESQLFNVGLPTKGILPGVEAEIGFDADFIFDTSFSQPVLTDLRGGVFSHSLNSTASASVSDASATSDYSATLSLESITVPVDFDAVDISGLSVVFDTGLTIPVTREGVSVPEPIPEPSSVLGTLIVGAFGAYFLLKRKLQKALLMRPHF